MPSCASDLWGMTWMRGWQLWRRPRPVVVLLLALVAAAGAVLAIAAAAPSRALTPGDAALLAVCVALVPAKALLSRRLGRLITNNRETTSDLYDLTALPCILLLPLWLALPVIGLLYAVHERLAGNSSERTEAPHQLTFNVSQNVISYYVGRLAFDVINPGGGLDSLAGMAGLAALLIIQSATSWGLIGVVLVLLGQVDVRGMVRAFCTDLLGSVTAWASGVLLTVCWLVNPVTIVALFPLLAALQRSVAYSVLLTQARQDAKTGLVNAERWRVVSESVLVRAGTDRTSVSVVIVDLDHFKEINDTYGHLSGDDVLREVAARLQGCVRPDDLVGRFGGEEFVVLLPRAGAGHAFAVADRCRQALGRLPITAGSAEITVTASFGVATTEAGRMGLTQLMELADAALYRAKDAGRDRVLAAGPVATAKPAAPAPSFAVAERA